MDECVSVVAVVVGLLQRLGIQSVGFFCENAGDEVQEVPGFDVVNILKLNCFVR